MLATLFTLSIGNVQINILLKGIFCSKLSIMHGDEDADGGLIVWMK